MKRFLLSVLILMMSWNGIGTAAFAADASPEAALLAETRVNGELAETVSVGDVIEVSVLIKRTDANSAYLLYALQDEIEYDTNLLTFLSDEGSIQYGFQQGYRKGNGSLARVLINFVDMSGQGVECEPEIIAATLKFRAAAAGETKLVNQSVIATDAKGEKRAIRTADLSLTIQKKDTSGGETGGTTGGVSGGSSSGSVSGGQVGNPGGNQAGSQTPTQPQQNLPAQGTTVQSTYQDVPQDAWYYPAVTFVSEKGLFYGVDQSSFAPDIPMTRAMFVTVLYRMVGSPANEEKASFSDIQPGSWYEKAVIWAAKEGIANGANGAFLPDQAITREQLAAMLARYARKTGLSLADGETEAFADEAQISAWAKEDVLTMQRAGMIHGMGGNRFAPQEVSTRAQVAQIFMNMLEE